MTTILYKETKEKVLFKDIPPGESFFCDGILWTKHEWSVDGLTGAVALVGFMRPDGFRSKLFDDEKAVFTVTQTSVA